MNKAMWILSILGLSFSAIGAGAVDSMETLTARAQQAATVLYEVVAIPDDAIPEALLNKAECVATIPNVIRAGFVFAGRYGQGVVSCRVPGGWSAPAYMTIAGASWGFQAGVQSVDVVLVFVRDNAIEKFSKNNFTLGADATIAAGPIGRDLQIGTDYQINSEIYSYSRTRGLFFGVALQGTAVTVDSDANHMVYGANMTANEVLRTDGNVTPGTGMEYIKALTAVAGSR